MKWKTEGPAEAEKKQVRHFAWLPTTVGEYTVWLETYQATYVYDKTREDWFETERNILVAYH